MSSGRNQIHLLAQLVPELFIKRPDFIDNPRFAGYDVRSRSGVKRTDGDNRRLKRIDPSTDRVLKITDELCAGDECILCPVGGLGMTTLTVDDDFKFIDGT